jgi:hypothetical protein
VLGYGSSGTVVFLGHFSGRKVAVKRMLLDFLDTTTDTSMGPNAPDDNTTRFPLPKRALREIEFLIQSGLFHTKHTH